MIKFLGLDIGTKRIGVAISENGLVASWGVVANLNLAQAIFEIAQICRTQGIQKIVIGIPKAKDSLQADKIHKFALEIKKNLNLEIAFVDETLTSREAERKLKDLKLDPRSKRYKEEVDRLSAKFILEQYLSK